MDERRDRSEAGDTLIEVLLTIVVLGLAAVALLIAFSTSISASATHRRLATADIVVDSTSQQAISGMASNLGLFQNCDSINVYQSLVPLSPGTNYGTYTAQITAVQWWNSATASFTSSCTPSTQDSPQLVTVTVTDANGHSYTNTFVVDYPLAGASAGINVGPATQLVWTTEPGSTAVASAAFTQQPVLSVENALGQPVSTDLSPVVLAIDSSSGSGSLSGCSGNEVEGVVTFSGCSISASGTYTLIATDGSLTSPESTSITVSGSTAPYLVFTTQPVGGKSGSALATQPVVKVYLAGSVDSGWSGTVTLASSGGVLSGCSTVTVTNGVGATPSCSFQGGYYYDPVSQATLPIPYTLYATAGGVTSATSNTFSVSGAGPASKLKFTSEPTGVSSASLTAPIPSFAVSVEDAFGNVVTTWSGTLGYSSNGWSGTNGGTLSSCSQSNSNGVVTFSNCHGTAYGTNLAINVSYSGLAGDTSSAFNITGLAASIAFTTQPVAGASGAVMTTQPAVTIYDSGGRVVTAATTAITLTPSGGTLTLCTNLTPINGVVDANTCTFAGLVGTQYTMTAKLGSITVTSAPFSPTVAGQPAQLVFATQPVAGASESAFSTQPVIDIEDSAGNIVTTSGASVTLTTSGGTLANCANLGAVSGVVNVSSCTFTGLVGTNYTMTASATLSNGQTQVTSAQFSPSGPGPASQVVLIGCSSNLQWNAHCTVTATLEDMVGNVETAYAGSITFAQTSGTGGVSGLGTDTASAGVSSIQLTGSTLGTLQVTASGDSFTSSPITITVVGAPQTASFYTDGSYTVTTSAASIAYGSAPTYMTYAQGSANGTITFASNSPTVCTINSGTGLVTILKAGTCNLTATAAATGNYAQSGAASFTLTITKVTPTNVVTNGAVPSLGGSVTFTATITGPGGASTPTGTVSWGVTGTAGISSCTTSTTTLSGGGTATCTITASKAGTIVVSDTYNGDTNYNSVASATDTVTINKVTPVVNVSNNTVSTGGNLVFTATVTGPAGGATPTGGGNYWTITGGAVACTSRTGPAGGSNVATYTCTVNGVNASSTYSATFNYPGDGNYNAASGSDNNVAVNMSTPTNVVTNSSPTTMGSSITFTATLTGGGPTPTGTVTWSVSGTAGVSSCSSSTTNLSGGGTATCTVTASAAGTIIVSDAYGGDTNYNNVTSANDTVNVAKATPSNVVTNGAVPSLGGSVTFTATLSGAGPTPTGTRELDRHGLGGHHHLHDVDHDAGRRNRDLHDHGVARRHDRRLGPLQRRHQLQRGDVGH